MKQILIDPNKVVTQIEAGSAEVAFPVHEDFRWIEVADDVEVVTGWVVNSDDSFTNPMVAWDESPIGKRMAMIESRTKAYGSFGSQLDMIYQDQINGTTEWRDHITKVKTDIEKVDSIIDEKGNEI